MQKYGMFLADGGNIALTAQSDQDTQTKYADVDFGPTDLSSLQVTDFEVVQMGPVIPLTYDCAEPVGLYACATIRANRKVRPFSVCCYS